MIWDACLAREVATELRERLIGARARALRFDRVGRAVHVGLRGATLTADLAPGRGELVVAPELAGEEPGGAGGPGGREKTGGAGGSGVGRKTGGKGVSGVPGNTGRGSDSPGDRVVPLPAVVAGVEAVRDERVIVVRFRRVRGRKPNPALILELATNRWNAVLAEGPELVVRMRLRMVRGRPHAIGQPWEAPGAGRGGSRRTGETAAAKPARPAKDAVAGTAGSARRAADLEEWEGLWRETAKGRKTTEGQELAQGLEVAEGREAAAGGGAAGADRLDRRRRLRSLLLRRFEWVSPLNVDGLLDAPDAAEAVRRWTRMAGGEPSPCSLTLPGGPQPYPFAVPGVASSPVESLLAAMAALRSQAAPNDGAAATDALVARALANRARRLGRKRDSLRRQLDRAGRAERLRADAALLLASLHRIEAGATSFALRGFDGAERTFELAPRERPQDRANALFRRAARLERAASELPARIRKTEEALATVAEQRALHSRGDLPRDHAEAIVQAHRAGARQGRGGAPARTGATLPYRRYQSSGGIEIRVGRGARRNDELTFRHSRPDDVWLHARHASGAHVVLRWTRPERPPAADLEEAAVLAANHSKARGSGQVPVDWTRRKWVRKPRRSPPGTVAPERVQTLFVAPDPSLGERLAS